MIISDLVNGLDKSIDTPFHIAWHLAHKMDGFENVHVMCRIAKTCQISGDKEVSSRLLETVLQKGEILKGLDLVEVQMKIAESAIECGNAEIARKALSKANQNIAGIEDKFKQSNMWVRMSDCHFKLGEVMEAGSARTEALEIAHELKEYKIDILRDVSGACRRAGDRISISGLIDQILAESGTLSGEEKYLYLLSLSEMYFDVGKDDQARKSLEEAVVLLDGLEKNEIIVVHLYSLAIIYAEHPSGMEKCRELAAKAMSVASGLEEGNSKDFALGMTARICLLAGNAEKALECANHVKGLARIKILLAVSVYFSENGKDSIQAIKLFIEAIGLFASLNEREKKRIRSIFPQMASICLDLKECQLDAAQKELIRKFLGI